MGSAQKPEAQRLHSFFNDMKRGSYQFCLLCSILCFFSGCGKQGDPLPPIVPLPLPVSEVSARTSEDGIVLSWTPPAAYDTEKTLELRDIKHFNIYRKIEAPLDTGWNFDQSSQGWTEVGQSLPPRRYHGVLRTTSDQRQLTLLSPDALNLQAEQNRFIRLKLWTNNAQQGYLAFITSDDTRWNRDDIDREFEPSVHSSFYAVRQAFDSSKLKRFPIRNSTSPTAQEYVIDMGSIPAWKGSIQQIGLILQNVAPEETSVELGLDSVEFIQDIDAEAASYHSAPWLFLDDEEGWRALPGETVFGAMQGSLYAEGDSPFVLLSAPGQRIQFTETAKLQLRMRVSSGNEAYLILRRGGEKFFRSEKELLHAVSRGIRIPLESSSDFSTYTLDLQPYVEAFGPLGADAETPDEEQASATLPAELPTNEAGEEPTTDAAGEEPADGPESLRLKKHPYFAQIGLVFPAVATSSDTRRVSIDYIDILPESADSELNASRLAQQMLPGEQELSREIHVNIREKRAAFELSYESIPEEQEQASVEKLLLAEISPVDPSPAKILLPAYLPEDSSTDELSPEAEESPADAPSKGAENRMRFELIDSGEFQVEDEEGESITAALEYGNRYSYEIEVVDRKKRENETAATISIEFMRAPSAPENLRAEAGDETVTLNWSRPIVTEDGKKIQQLAAYRIFRSTIAGDYPDEPLGQVPASQTEFVDTAVTNRETYYYVIQALASQLPGTGSSDTSIEVSAMPLDISAPDAPTGLVGVYIQDKVNLHWNQVHTPDFSGFNIYRSSSRDGEFTQLNTEVLRKASFTDRTTEAKKRYYYYVTAIDDETPPNESDPSELEPVETYTLD